LLHLALRPASKLGHYPNSTWLDKSADGIHRGRTQPNKYVSGPNNREFLLRFHTAMSNRSQDPGIKPGVARQLFSINLIAFPNIAHDRMKFGDVGPVKERLIDIADADAQLTE